MLSNLVGEEWLRPNGEVLPVYNPAVSEVIEEVSLSGPEEVEAAVAAAVRAFPAWAATSILERAALSIRFKALLEEHLEVVVSRW